MNYFYDLINNKPLACAVTGWFVAQILKILITAVVEKTLDWGRLLAPGGMPSSHSTFVTGLAVTIAFQYGFGSVYFALAAAFALVVMYDACGVRRAVGEQAQALNNILEKLKETNSLVDQSVVREILGHTPLQVAMGFLLGIVIAVIYRFTM
jgi:hypothetical protein